MRTGYREQTTARADSVVWKVIDSLIAQPVVNSTYVAETFGISAVAAQRAIARLVQSGVLRLVSQRARNRVWQADAILTALDDFAAGVRSRPGVNKALRFNSATTAARSS
ncbi:hypothetical protein [Nocardia ignorata]|uniref:hypothetical protein n=1 Tax=Nocardia ignorata TaxID=145285 RepID=UPI001C3F69B4|nr:hypothetical protein [Nocardia ignorata]